MILGICGSPRKQATEYVLTEALSALEKMGFKTNLFTVRGKNISFCQHCDYCLKNKKCKINDDMQTLYPLLKQAEAIVFATPVYNSAITAQTKTIMDRCRALFAENKNALRNKIGIAITIGGDRMGGQELAAQQIHTFYIINRAIPVGGGAFGANLGATFWSKDTLKDVKQDQEGFKTLNKTLKRLAEILKENQKRKPS